DSAQAGRRIGAVAGRGGLVRRRAVQLLDSGPTPARRPGRLRVQRRLLGVSRSRAAHPGRGTGELDRFLFPARIQRRRPDRDAGSRDAAQAQRSRLLGHQPAGPGAWAAGLAAAAAVRTGLLAMSTGRFFEALPLALQRVAEGNKMALAEFRRALEADGVSFELWREDLREQILLTRLREREVDDKIQVSDTEVALFLEEMKAAPAERVEYNLSHIL